MNYNDPIPRFNTDFSYGKLYTAISRYKANLLISCIGEICEEHEYVKNLLNSDIELDHTKVKEAINKFIQLSLCNLTNIKENHPLYESAINLIKSEDLKIQTESLFSIWNSQPVKIYTQIYANSENFNVQNNPDIYIKGYLLFNIYKIQDDKTFKLEIANAIYRADNKIIQNLKPITKEVLDPIYDMLIKENIIGVSISERKRLEMFLKRKKEIFG